MSVAAEERRRLRKKSARACKCAGCKAAYSGDQVRLRRKERTALVTLIALGMAIMFTAWRRDE